MRNFSWGFFSTTGSIEAYMLFKEHEEFVDTIVHEISATREKAGIEVENH